MKESRLDEMQELKLLKIESAGYWIAFWGLFVSYMVQSLLEVPFKYYAGEMILFFILSVYMIVRCFIAGIWDRHLKPTLKSNFILSLFTALIFGTVIGIRAFIAYNASISGCIISGAISGAFLYLILFAMLQIMATGMKSKNKLAEKKLDIEELVEDEVEE